MPVIVFNGKTYNSIEEMPANERQAFEQMSHMFVDKNGNGIPDFLEGDMVQKVLAVHSSNMHVTVNGKPYHTLEDLPPDLRQNVDQAFQMLSNMGILSNIPNVQAPQANREAVVESRPFIAPQSSPVIEEDQGNRSIFSLVIIGVVLCFALTSAAIAIFYFMNR